MSHPSSTPRVVYFTKVVFVISLLTGCMALCAEENKSVTEEHKPLIKVFKTDAEVVASTSRKIADLLIKKKQMGKATLLGLSTSTSLMPIYKKLREIIKEEKIDLSRVTIFSADEFSGIAAENPQSHYYQLFTHFFEGILWRPDNPQGIKRRNIYFPNGKAKVFQNLSSQERSLLLQKFPKRKKGTPLDENEELWILQKRAEAYDALVKKMGPIDLQIVDIHSNGQMGFLETDTSFTEASQVVKLTDKVRKEHIRFFNNDLTLVPQYVICLGMRHILLSKIIFLIAMGKDKAAIIEKMLTAPISPEISGTGLRLNAQVVFFLDKPAAADLKGKHLSQLESIKHENKELPDT